jgi:hypothetical protein
MKHGFPQIKEKMQDSGCRIQDAGYRIQDTGFKIIK